MLRLHRLDLSDEDKKELKDLAGEIEGKTLDERKKSARTLFKNNRGNNLLSKTVVGTLEAMNAGSGRCFYCQLDRGNAIEHYEPIDKDPDKAFDWDNYLWACNVCNSSEKGKDFPKHSDGRSLLLNPVEKDPYDYLPLNREGFYLEFDKNHPEEFHREVNNATLKVLGLNEYGSFIQDRKDAWELIESELPSYPQSSIEQRVKLQAKLTDRPIVVSVLAFMLHTFDTHSVAQVILGDSLHQAIAQCADDIRIWTNPQARAGQPELIARQDLHGKRTTRVEQDDDGWRLYFENGAEVMTKADNASQAENKILLNTYNRKGMIVFQFRDMVELIAPPGEWVLQP